MRKHILFAFCLFFFPLYVHADSVILDCPSEITTGSEFTCTVKGSSNNSINGVDAYIKLSTGLSLVSFSNGAGWMGDAEGGHIALYTDADKTGTFNIGSIKLKHNSGESNTVMISNTIFYYGQTGENKPSAVSKTINLKQTNQNNDNNNQNNTSNDGSTTNDNKNNNDNTPNPSTTKNDNQTKEKDNNVASSSVFLKDLVIENYDINFKSNTFTYTLEIADEETLSIIPTLESDDSTYRIIGNDNLKNGSIIIIQVISNDEVTKQNYRIDIIKKDANKRNYGIFFIAIIAILIIINVLRLVMNRRRKNG